MNQFKRKNIQVVVLGNKCDYPIEWCDVKADCLSHLAIHHEMRCPTHETHDWTLTHICSGRRLFSCYEDQREEIEKAALELDPEFEDFPEDTPYGEDFDMETAWARRVAPKIYAWLHYFYHR